MTINLSDYPHGTQYLTQGIDTATITPDGKLLLEQGVEIVNPKNSDGIAK